MYDCYHNVIGFTDKDCPCNQSDDRPEDYDVSESGIYLDGLIPIDELDGYNKCDEGLWTMLYDARADAIRAFVGDTNVKLGERFTSKRLPALGIVIGKPKAYAELKIRKNYGVLRLCCAPVRGGYMTLNNIGLVFSSVGDVRVALRSSNSDIPIKEWDITTVAGRLASVPEALTLPLYDKLAGEGMEYYFTYIYDEANKPRDTIVDCGCGSWRPVFDTNNPYYVKPNTRRTGFANWCMPGAMSVNSISELYDEPLPSSLDSKSAGISINVSFTCKVDEVLCNTKIDWHGDPLAMSIALAIRYRTAMIIAEEVIRNPKPSEANMTQAAEWAAGAAEWAKHYEGAVEYITSQANLTANDCLRCKDVFEIVRSPVVA